MWAFKYRSQVTQLLPSEPGRGSISQPSQGPSDGPAKHYAICLLPPPSPPWARFLPLSFPLTPLSHTGCLASPWTRQAWLLLCSFPDIFLSHSLSSFKFLPRGHLIIEASLTTLLKIATYSPSRSGSLYPSYPWHVISIVLVTVWPVCLLLCVCDFCLLEARTLRRQDSTLLSALAHRAVAMGR